MNLVDEAQLQYDELEASFFQALKGFTISFDPVRASLITTQKKTCPGLASWEEMLPGMIQTPSSMSILSHIVTLY